MTELLISILSGMVLLVMSFLVWIIKENTKAVRANMKEQIKLEAKMEVLSGKIEGLFRTKDDVTYLHNKIRNLERHIKDV